MMDEIEKLRPHRLTRDIASVSYRALHIRQLFRRIDEQRSRIATLEIQANRLKQERDEARTELDELRESMREEAFERDIAIP